VVARLEAQGPETWRPEAPPPLRAPAVPPRGVRRHRRSLAAATVAVAVALLALVVAGVLDEDGRRVDLAALPGGVAGGASGEARLTSGSVSVEARLAPSRPGEYYELWTLDGERVISLGTFRAGDDGEASARFTLGVRPTGALDVSVEPVDGDPSHSTRSFLRSEPL
jgi:anti-sigma-K factor RskA